MNRILAKVYYLIATGEVLTITGECQGPIEERTKEQDFEAYPELRGKNINDIDFITLQYGTLATTFNNCKSYTVNLETKKLEVEYYTDTELQTMRDQEQQGQGLENRVNDISDYLYQQSADTIVDFENYILQNEINKLMEGMN